MSMISVIGYVCNLKRYNNDDGSITLYFSVSCKTQDSKRWSDNTQRDFWNVDLYIPKSRTKLADYIQEKKLISVGGVPYKRFADVQDKNTGQTVNREFASIKGISDLIDLLPSGNNNNQGGNNNQQQNNAPANNQNANPPQQNANPPANNQQNTNPPQNNQNQTNQGNQQPQYQGGKPIGEGW